MPRAAEGSFEVLRSPWRFWARDSAGYGGVVELQIEKIKAKSLKVPLARAIGSANSTKSELDYLLVFLHTENGPTGCGFVMSLGGETSRVLVHYIEKELAPLAVGRDALAPEALWQRLWGPNKARMRGGLGVQALSAIDTACWDALAKAAGAPLQCLLGGFRKKVPVYGSGGWLTFTDSEMVEECQGFMERGIGAYKLKLGSPRDEERIRLLRDEAGESLILFADANQKYTPREALEVAAMLAAYDVKWFEEPVLADSVDDLAEVAQSSPTPIAAGENAYMRWGFREICERRAASFLQPDVGRCGGVTEFRKAAHLAEAYNLALCSHLLQEVSVGLVAATPSGYMVEYVDMLPPDVLTREFPVVGGCMEVPDTPGHGVEFTEGAIRTYGA